MGSHFKRCSLSAGKFYRNGLVLGQNIHFPKIATEMAKGFRRTVIVDQVGTIIGKHIVDL